jgi:hypothetical protein
MAQDVATLKREITSVLDLLPPESLQLLRDFAAFLRTRAGQPASQEGRIVKLGGLWAGYTFSEEEITAARREAWAGLGEGFNA